MTPTETAGRPLSFYRSGWLPTIHRRFSQALEAARSIPFDDSSRFVLFSDLHRGNGGRGDRFLPNAELFLSALSDYVQRGFGYIEVGDGDELWKGWSFEEIRYAHRRVFELLNELDRQRRLHLVLGNHDVRRRTRQPELKDGMLRREGLVLRHRPGGQRLFVVHGHQADILCDPMYFFARRAARFGYRLRDWMRRWRPLDHLQQEMGKLEHRIIHWINAHSQIVICGHTHRLSFPREADPPYFNTGSGLIPGIITGLEIQFGEIVPVRIVAESRGRYRREQLGRPYPIR
jgi:UDP-2,3-diacylglucosamine pyrophosphatase LpxH